MVQPLICNPPQGSGGGGGAAGADYAFFSYGGANLAANGVFYGGIGTGGGSLDTTEANFTNDADFTGEFNTFHINVKSNSKNATTTVAFRVAGSNVGALSVTASSTGEFESVGNSDAISTNDNINFVTDTNASSSGTFTTWTGYVRVKIDSVE